MPTRKRKLFVPRKRIRPSTPLHKLLPEEELDHDHFQRFVQRMCAMAQQHPGAVMSRCCAFPSKEFRDRFEGHTILPDGTATVLRPSDPGNDQFSTTTQRAVQLLADNLKHYGYSAILVWTNKTLHHKRQTWVRTCNHVGVFVVRRDPDESNEQRNKDLFFFEPFRPEAAKSIPNQARDMFTHATKQGKWQNARRHVIRGTQNAGDEDCVDRVERFLQQLVEGGHRFLGNLLAGNQDGYTRARYDGAKEERKKTEKKTEKEVIDLTLEEESETGEERDQQETEEQDEEGWDTGSERQEEEVEQDEEWTPE